MRTFIVTYRLPNGFEINVISNLGGKNVATDEANALIRKYIQFGSQGQMKIPDCFPLILEYDIKPSVEEWKISEARASTGNKTFIVYPKGGGNFAHVRGAGVKSTVSNIIKQSSNPNIFPLVIIDMNQIVKPMPKYSYALKYIRRYRHGNDEVHDTLYVFVDSAVSTAIAKVKATKGIVEVTALYRRHQVGDDNWGESNPDALQFAKFKDIEPSEIVKIHDFKDAQYKRGEHIIYSVPDVRKGISKLRYNADNTLFDFMGSKTAEQEKQAYEQPISISEVYRNMQGRGPCSFVLVTKDFESIQAFDRKYNYLKHEEAEQLKKDNEVVPFLVSFRRQHKSKVYEMVGVVVFGRQRKTSEDELGKLARKAAFETARTDANKIAWIKNTPIYKVTECKNTVSNISYPISSCYAVCLVNSGGSIDKTTVLSKDINPYQLSEGAEFKGGTLEIYRGTRFEPMSIINKYITYFIGEYRTHVDGIVIYTQYSPELAMTAFKAGKLSNDERALHIEYAKQLQIEKQEKAKAEAAAKQEELRIAKEKREAAEAEARRVAQLKAEEDRRKREAQMQIDKQAKLEEARRRAAEEADRRKAAEIERRRKAEEARLQAEERERQRKEAEEINRRNRVDYEFSRLQSMRYSIETDLNRLGDWKIDQTIISNIEKKLGSLKTGIQKFNSLANQSDKIRLKPQMDQETAQIRIIIDKVNHLKSGKSLGTYGKRNSLVGGIQSILNGRS